MGISCSSVLLTEFPISCFFWIRLLRAACPFSSYLSHRLNLFPVWPLTSIWLSQLSLHFLTKAIAHLTYDICQTFLPSWVLLRRCRKKHLTKLNILSWKNYQHIIYRRNVLQHTKGHIWQDMTWYKIRSKTRMPTLTISIQHSAESPSYSN